MKYYSIITHITNFLAQKLTDANKKGFVVGVSGGIDSALTSTLCALTGFRTSAIALPLNSKKDHLDKAIRHISWLYNTTKNVTLETTDLTDLFHQLRRYIPLEATNNELVIANTKSRLRMVILYAVAQARDALVAGTGNKVEDYGLGFFTKYGDGGVDISPIGDLTKTEVWDLAKFLGINQEIIDAPPTDGLWEDGRTDEDQIGASYKDIEWAMATYDAYKDEPDKLRACIGSLKQSRAMEAYTKFHEQNAHKMQMPPICQIPKEYR